MNEQIREISITDIQKVQKNLVNIQAFNDYVYNSGNAYIANCFILLGQQDNSDPGKDVGTSLFEGIYGTIFGVFDPVGSIASIFMCSLISDWTVDNPPNLAQTFSSMLIRADKSHVQLDQDISVYIENTEAYWNKKFTWNNTTITLGELSTIDFPSTGTSEFYDLVQVALKGFDKSVWRETLKINCKNSWLMPYTHSQCTEINGKTDINSWYISFLQAHPSFYCTWSWHQDTGLFDKNYWYVDEHCLNFKDGNAQKFKCIPDGACEYLFIDSADGVIINQTGLFTRSYVFNDMGLQKVIISTATPTQENHNTGIGTIWQKIKEIYNSIESRFYKLKRIKNDPE